MVCKFCGNDNPIGATNCAVCGRRLIVYGSVLAGEEDREYGGPDPEFLTALQQEQERQRLLELERAEERNERINKLRRVMTLLLLAVLIAAVLWFCLFSPSSPMCQLMSGVSRSDVGQIAIKIINISQII